MHTKACVLVAATAAILVPTLTSCRGTARTDARAVVSASTSATSSASVTRPPPPPPSPEELALIAPIQKGSALGTFVVRDVRGVEDGVLRIVCAKDDVTVRLDVALFSDDAPMPPAHAGKYAIYYSIRKATPEEGAELAKKLAAAIGAHADLPPPKGMTPFVPKPTPGTTL